MTYTDTEQPATRPARGEDAEAADRRKLWSLVEDIRVAMMTTVDEGTLRARPMVGMQDDFEGTLWFLTRSDAHKLDELGDGRQVNLAYADPRAERYVSVSGRADVIDDPDMVEQLWTEDVARRFPAGRDDPELRLIRVTPEMAEYWDGPSGTVSRLWLIAKARVSGEEPELREHGRVADPRGQ